MGLAGFRLIYRPKHEKSPQLLGEEHRIIIYKYKNNCAISEIMSCLIYLDPTVDLDFSHSYCHSAAIWNALKRRHAAITTSEYDST